MNNWGNLFKPWILARGQEYYDCGQVVKLEETDGVVTALVSGSRLYHVKIRRSGKYGTDMSCDCPYAAGGESCKHMAAVLVALDRKSLRQDRDWQTALAQMGENQLRELLQNLAAADGALQDRIQRMVFGPGNALGQWQGDLEEIISDYTDYEGYLNYDHAYDCMLEIAEYLEECLPSLLGAGQIVDAAKFVMAVYDTAWSQEMDDSDGGLSIVSEHCRVATGKILSMATSRQEQEIFALFHELLEDNAWVYGSENLEDLIFSLDWSPELQQKNLEYLDENLDSWRMGQRADLMERMGASTAERIAWWKQYRNDDGAYRPLLHLYEEEDLPKAMELVREKRELANNTPWQLISYTKTLLHLLEKTGNSREYEKELRHLVLELKCREEKYVSQLKKITSAEQWPTAFQRLLEDAKRPADRMWLYHFEGMYGELLAELCRHPDLLEFQIYEEELRNWAPDRTLQLYTDILKAEMARACDRTRYHQVASHLSKLDAYPCGRESAQELAAYWHVCHKNRPAMKDELKKAGYPQKP